MQTKHYYYNIGINTPSKKIQIKLKVFTIASSAVTTPVTLQIVTLLGVRNPLRFLQGLIRILV